MARPKWKPPLATQTILSIGTLIALIYESCNNIRSNIPYILLQKPFFQSDLTQLCLFNTHNEMLKLLRTRFQPPLWIGIITSTQFLFDRCIKKSCHIRSSWLWWGEHNFRGKTPNYVKRYLTLLLQCVSKRVWQLWVVQKLNWRGGVVMGHPVYIQIKC